MHHQPVMGDDVPGVEFAVHCAPQFLGDHVIEPALITAPPQPWPVMADARSASPLPTAAAATMSSLPGSSGWKLIDRT